MIIPAVSGICEFEGKKTYFVDEAFRHRKEKMVVVPMMDKEGAVGDYDAFNEGLQLMLKDILMVTPTEHPIIFTEPSLHNKEYRKKITQFLFEKYQIPAFFICKSSVLSAFSCGRTTALVLESGANFTYSVPIHDGYALQNSLIRCEIAGNYLTEEIMKVITKGKSIKVCPRYAFTKKIVNEQPTIDYLHLENIHPSLEKFHVYDIGINHSGRDL